MRSVEGNLRRMAGALSGRGVDDDPAPLMEVAPDLDEGTRGALILMLTNEADHLRELQEGGDDRVVVSRSILEMVDKNLLSVATGSHNHDPEVHQQLLDIHQLTQVLMGKG